MTARKKPYEIREFEPGWTEDTEKLEALTLKICTAIAGALQREVTPDEMETILVTVNECIKAGHTEEVLIAVYAVTALSDFSVGAAAVRHH